MSSDHLNYSLSKQLHDLGVEFEDRGYRYVKPDGDTEPRFMTPKSIPNVLPVERIIAPSTAQLIDKLMDVSEWGRDVNICPRCGTYDIEWDNREIEQESVCDSDFTTALGEALIALVRGEECE